MFETFRERLLNVQQDLSAGLKTLSDRSKDVNVKRKLSKQDEYDPCLNAGTELLNRYEDSWSELHRQAEACARLGEGVDALATAVSASWEQRCSRLAELVVQMRLLPSVVTQLDSLLATLGQLEGECEELEDRLGHLEDMCEECELRRATEQHARDALAYEQRKGKEHEAFKMELEGEHVRRSCEAERSHALRLRERQRFFEEAFQQDVEHYLSTGVLQLHSAGSGTRQPLGSVSSMEVNVDLLEQVELLDVSDHEALDVFLNSPSSPSVASASDSSSCSSTATSATSSVSSMGPSCQTSPRHVWRASSTTSSSSEASGPDSSALFSPLPPPPLPPLSPPTTTATAGNFTANIAAVVATAVGANDDEDEEEGNGVAVPSVQADEEEVFVDTELTAASEDSSPRPCDSDTD
ncbi:dysbindin-like isoform X2 [Lethenteron reissneri]|uniref:dysbindin-like isoform X2 n=1 Tax=Lethenteron reissneri TaxID=7753 RepID=UPI002AB7A098|nr:dysbindin-like isoform X2 [Lethenteron reissneri]